MADAPKKKFQPTSFSPKARAVFPRLNTPDTKFKAEGRYSVKIRMPEAEARAFLAKFESLSEENFKEVLAAHSNDIDKKTGKPLPPPTNDGLPFTLELDESKKPNGFMQIAFNMNAEYKNKKTGQQVKQKPGMFDSQGRPVAVDVQVGGGSLIKVAFQPSGYFTDSSRKAGISFRLQAVQIIELVKFGGVAFDKEEGGFVAEDQGFQPEEGSAPSVPTTGAGNF